MKQEDIDVIIKSFISRDYGVKFLKKDKLWVKWDRNTDNWILLNDDKVFNDLSIFSTEFYNDAIRDGGVEIVTVAIELFKMSTQRKVFRELKKSVVITAKDIFPDSVKDLNDEIVEQQEVNVSYNNHDEIQEGYNV